MPSVTTDQGLTLPILADAADEPVSFTNFVAGVEQRLVRLYANEAARTANRAVVAEGEISSLTAEDRTEIYNGTTDVSLYTRALFARPRVAANQALTSSSTVLQNVTNQVASLPGTAGAIFHWRNIVFYDASATADIKFAYTIPAAATMRWAINALGTGGTNPTYVTTTASGTAVAAGALGVGTVLQAYLEGEIIMGATPGNLQLQAAQNTSDATNINIFLGSYLEIWRLS